MSELEKKFRKYMSNRWGNYSYQSKIIAHDLAEIAEKENTELKDRLKNKIIGFREHREAYMCLAKRRREYANHLSVVLREKNKIIKELKKELADIKYLDGDEVEKIIRYYFSEFRYASLKDMINDKETAFIETTTAICSLAIPETPRNLTKEELAKEEKYEKKHYKTLAMPKQKPIEIDCYSKNGEILGDGNEIK